MFYITQLIYLKPGEEKVFDQFESMAIPIIGNYNGKLLLRIRPEADAYIEHSIEPPYEIHLVQFKTEKDFVEFSMDEERKKFLHLKEASIRAGMLIKGTEL